MPKIPTLQNCKISVRLSSIFVRSFLIVFSYGIDVWDNEPDPLSHLNISGKDVKSRLK